MLKKNDTFFFKFYINKLEIRQIKRTSPYLIGVDVTVEVEKYLYRLRLPAYSLGP
jgi:hypothetical protein